MAVAAAGVVAVGSLQGQRGGVHGGRSPRGDRRGDPGALRCEFIPIAEADDERPPRGAGVHQRGLLVGGLDVLGPGRARERLGKVVAIEDEHPDEVGLDLGERLVSDLDAQRAPDYRRSLTFRARTWEQPVGAVGPPAQTKGADVEDGHPLHRQDPLREDGRRALVPRCHRPGRHRDLRGARPRRGEGRRGPGCRLRPGAAGRPGPDSLPPGPDQGRHPARGSLGDDQQGLRLRHADDRHRRPGCSRRRSRHRASRAAWSR